MVHAAVAVEVTRYLILVAAHVHDGRFAVARVLRVRVIDEARIAAYKTAKRAEIERYVNEPGLIDIIEENIDRYLFFTTNIDEEIDDADVIFLCLPTPPSRDGSTDLDAYFNAVDHLAQLLSNRNSNHHVVLVNKSTVPIGSVRLLQKVMEEKGVKKWWAWFFYAKREIYK